MNAGQQTSPYARAAAALGYDEDVAEVQAAYREGGAKMAGAAVSDRLVHGTSIVGPLDDCRARIDELLSAGADRVFVTMPAATRAECEPILAGLIPDSCR